MVPQTFSYSDSLTMGVELELQLLSLSDFDLTPASPDLLYLLGQREFSGMVSPEITESMIEIGTSIHFRYEDLLRQLLEIKNTLIEAGDRLNIGISGGGTHPFQQWSERKIFLKSRFQEVSIRYGYLAKQFTIFGQHIHIGCSSGDDAMYLLHALNPYVPHFIALSASSPYVQGKPTLFQSARLNSVFAFPLSGRAPFILSWEAFVSQYLEKMIASGIASSMKDFYWDIRPKPEYGTIELRVCDTPLTVERAAALAAYLQALCAYLLAQREHAACEEDYLVYQHNRFQACRFGLDGMIVHPRTYAHTLLRESIINSFIAVEPYAKKLGSLEGINYLKLSMEHYNDAEELQQQFSKTYRIEDTVNYAIARFRSQPS